MRRILGLALLAALLPFARPVAAQPADAGPLTGLDRTYDAQQKAVYAALNGFWKAVLAFDTAAAAKFVAKADPQDPDLKELAAQWKIARGNLGRYRIVVDGLPTINVVGNHAEAVVTLVVRDALNRTVGGGEKLTLHRQDDPTGARWLIEAAKPDDIWEDDAAGYLDRSASALAYPRETLDTVYLEKSLHNFVDIYNAVIQFGAEDIGDEHKTLTAHTADLPALLRKTGAGADLSDKELEELVSVPGGGSYTLNEKLNGTKIEAHDIQFDAFDMKDQRTDKLIVLYEGSDEKPLFRFNGKALILFEDGKFRLIPKEAAAKLQFAQ